MEQGVEKTGEMKINRIDTRSLQLHSDLVVVVISIGYSNSITLARSVGHPLLQGPPHLVRCCISVCKLGSRIVFLDCRENIRIFALEI